MNHFDVLIVGSGHAGAQAAIALRQLNFGGRIAILSREFDPPYERPPLSKDYLAGERPFERILIRPETFWRERDVALQLGQEVIDVDPEARVVTCTSGNVFGYSKLIWAAGGDPRRLGCVGRDLAGVHGVRSRADIDRMIAELPDVQRVAVVGGGYIGLEAAAVLAKLDKHVVVLEAQGRVLARVAAEPLSRFYEAEHRAHGVDIRLGVTVESIEGRDGRASAVRLADGSSLPVDMVIVGIGIAPAADPLLRAGAAGLDGVEVDEHCRSTLPHIYAVGDCAAHRNRFAGGARIRLESVQNAHDQASTAARDIVGQPQAYDSLPWFWSNQYDLRLQTVGIGTGHDDVIVRGDPATRSFSLVYRKAGRVIALDCVNATRDYAQGRALVMAGAMPDPAMLADVGVPLKSLLA